MAEWQVIQGDCLDVLRTLPDASVDAVITDPPYFRVKAEAWDRQWGHDGAYLDWLSSIIDEWHRVLRSNGSLYCFASPQMAARVEVRIGQRFNVLNRVRWIKEAGWHNKADKETLRSFLSPWEEVIFAEHYGADNAAKGEAGYGAKCDELRGFVFEPLRAYLDGERRRAGVDKADCNAACGFSRTPGGMASRHYFSASQWALPTQEHYEALRRLFNQSGGDYLRREYEDLRREYEDLRREYEDLRREYEDLRRPFSVTPEVPYTDVWTFKTVQAYKGKHPCEKPVDMMEHIIRTSTRPGAVVLDCFAGSGSTGVACARNDRTFIGIEKDEAWADYSRRRIAEAANNLYARAQ